MSEIIADKKVFALSEVTNSIKKTISERYTSTFWVKAEMNKLNFYRHSGHCYPELLEKKDGRVVAQMRAILWSSDYLRINEQFIRLLKEPLKDGINIMFEASISFDPVHGITIRIHNMEPAFTLGDLELEKSESIRRLKAEGIFDQNKQLSLPMLPMRVAVISVETSKGYADFKKTLEDNPFRFRFFLRLYPALLQGEKAVPSIRSQLDRIRNLAHHFDAVAIIRGGGGEVGLSCYNHYDLAKSIADFPLPVLTGIGHATNITVSEMVSHTYGITPTAVAEVLLNKARDFAEKLKRCTEVVYAVPELLQEESEALDLLAKAISQNSLQQLKSTHLSLERLSNNLGRTVSSRIHRESEAINEKQSALAQSKMLTMQSLFSMEHLSKRLSELSVRRFHEANSSLSQLEHALRLLDPQEVVKRGYSLTLHKGKVLKSIRDIQEGAVIETLIADGQFESSITKIKNNQS
jgi:exodeoxyribonuclease VII large subunit